MLKTLVYILAALLLSLTILFVGTYSRPLGSLGFSSLTASATSSPSIGVATSTLVVAARSNRVALSICNPNSTSDVYIGHVYSAVVASGTGVYLKNGTCANLTGEERWTGPVYGIAIAATTTLVVEELY